MPELCKFGAYKFFSETYDETLVLSWYLTTSTKLTDHEVVSYPTYV